MFYFESLANIRIPTITQLSLPVKGRFAAMDLLNTCLAVAEKVWVLPKKPRL